MPRPTAAGTAGRRAPVQPARSRARTAAGSRRRAPTAAPQAARKTARQAARRRAPDRRAVLRSRRRRRLLPLAGACLLLIVGLVTGRCHGGTDPTAGLRAAADPSAAPSVPSAPPGRPAGHPAAMSTPDLTGRLAARLDAYLAHEVGHPVRLSVAVTDHASGATAVYHPGLAFQTASVVKLDVLATLLLRAQDAHRRLSATEHDLAAQMITVSDNDATTRLWDMVGGARQIAAVNRRCGLTRTVPDPTGWGLTRTTAADQARLVDVLVGGAGPIGTAGVALARELLGGVADEQSWGVSAAALPGEVTLLKNGWDRRDSDGDRWIVNSVGSIRSATGPLTLVVLSDGHPDRDAGIAVVEHVAKLTREQLDA